VKARILHAAVGGINESDVTLAKASGGMIIGFNVRANPQAREMAKRDGVDIRYYSIIYDVIDDMKAADRHARRPCAKTSSATPDPRSVQHHQVRQGRRLHGHRRHGQARRKVRLLRDNVVIHEGTLKTLKRFKDEVREVKEGFECGMAFENYDDINKGDVIECFEMEEVARELVEMRVSPQLRFKIDDSFEEASRIEALLHDPVVRADIAKAKEEAKAAKLKDAAPKVVTPGDDSPE
jgi:translation initiation factor IF-2